MSFFSDFFRVGLIKIGVMSKPDFVVKKVNKHPKPKDMKVGVIYVVGGPGYVKWAYFRCPVDRDEIVQLSLMTNREPSWCISSTWLDVPTVYPSVRRLDGSYAHFWIKDGKIDWCADTGRKSPKRPMHA